MSDGEIGVFKLPKDENSLKKIVERGQHTKGFVVYCQLITEKITDQAFCEKCPFHMIHIKTRIPIICTSDKKFTYAKNKDQIKMIAEGVESLEFPIDDVMWKITQPKR